jgi:hypothetical protein
MHSAIGFPLPFSSLRTIRGGEDASYIIGAFFTPGYADKAQRLASSCNQFGLPYEIHEVPAVHRSISSNGTQDAAFTKANFIRHMLSRHNRPVLYVDADCEFQSYPKLLEPMARSQCDFAVYNWLADEYTDAFVPLDVTMPNGQKIKNRFYSFSHNVGQFSTSQLLCSGSVQFYRNSIPAKALLQEWFQTVLSFPGTADDECLDFAFNHLNTVLRICWFPKAYARYRWWIYAKPVINHPDPTNENNFVRIKDPAGRLRYYAERTEKRDEVRLFPRNCIIDTEQQMICRMVDGQLVAQSPTDQNFWL